MKNTVFLDSINLANDDSLSYIKTLPDNCIDLIATDPPYFQVKSCSWDNQWENVGAYLSWLDEMLAEFWRVLKPNGSLYLFCGSRLASDTELLVRSEHPWALLLDITSKRKKTKSSGIFNQIVNRSLRRPFLLSSRRWWAYQNNAATTSH